MQKISKHEFEYAGRKVQVGDLFECDPSDVRLLTDLGWIRDAQPSYQTRDMVVRRKKSS